MHDNWLFDVPISLKPTFLNMDFNFENVVVSSLTKNYSCDKDMILHLFGSGTGPLVTRINISFSPVMIEGYGRLTSKGNHQLHLLIGF